MRTKEERIAFTRLLEEEQCARCGHRPHWPNECRARYRVTLERGEEGDPCLCGYGNGGAAGGFGN